MTTRSTVVFILLQYVAAAVANSSEDRARAAIVRGASSPRNAAASLRPTKPSVAKATETMMRFERVPQSPRDRTVSPSTRLPGTMHGVAVVSSGPSIAIAPRVLLCARVGTFSAPAAVLDRVQSCDRSEPGTEARRPLASNSNSETSKTNKRRGDPGKVAPQPTHSRPPSGVNGLDVFWTINLVGPHRCWPRRRTRKWPGI